MIWGGGDIEFWDLGFMIWGFRSFRDSERFRIAGLSGFRV